MRFRSVDWALLGCGIFGFLLLVSFMFYSMFLFGFAWGWGFCGVFWTWWITYNRKKEGSQE